MSITATLDRLMAARPGLQQRPVAEILAALDRVVGRWLDPADPIRREAEQRIGAGTGLAPAMLRTGLDQLVTRVREIGVLLDQDLGDRHMLDRFVKRAPGIRSRAWGPDLTVCIFAGNVPGIPAFDIALALALKSPCLARPAAAEPDFAALWARSIAEVDPDLGRCVAVERWEYEENEPLQRAGAVIVYGSDATVAAVRSRVGPGVRFLGHGHRVGVAVVAREAASRMTARGLALDVAMYDQQGCVSPHVAFVERGGELAPAEFARACGTELAALEQEMPRSPLSTAEAALLRRVRDEAEFTADALFASPTNLAWTVVHSENPAFAPSPLNRLLRTCAIDGLEQVPALLGTAEGLLQTVAYAGPPERSAALATALGVLGASRICPVGRVQTLSGLWRHDGRPTAGDLVRWTEIESAPGEGDSH